MEAFYIYRILVVDTDITLTNMIQKYLSKTYERAEVIYFNNLNDASRYITKHDVNYLFISIFDDFISSFKFASHIRSMDKYKFLPIVFLSTYTDYIIMAYKEIHCCDYIIRPINTVDMKRLTDLIEYHIRLFSRASTFNSKCITFDAPHFYVKLSIDEILFVESYKRKCTIHTYTEELVVTMPMCHILEMACGKSLIQSHRSFLVNTGNIKKLDKLKDPWVAYFIAYNKTALVSRSFKKSIQSNMYSI